MSYQGRHQAKEAVDRRKWSAFLYGLWAMRIDATDINDNGVAFELARYLNAEYSLVLRWMAETEEVTVADVQYVANMCEIDAQMLLEKVSQ